MNKKINDLKDRELSITNNTLTLSDNNPQSLQEGLFATDNGAMNIVQILFQVDKGFYTCPPEIFERIMWFFPKKDVLSLRSLCHANYKRFNLEFFKHWAPNSIVLNVDGDGLLIAKGVFNLTSEFKKYSEQEFLPFQFPVNIHLKKWKLDQLDGFLKELFRVGTPDNLECLTLHIESKASQYAKPSASGKKEVSLRHALQFAATFGDEADVEEMLGKAERLTSKLALVLYSLEALSLFETALKKRPDWQLLAKRVTYLRLKFNKTQGNAAECENFSKLFPNLEP